MIKHSSYAFVFAVLTAGCNFVGMPYRYGGQQYTMTKTNSDYHQHAVNDVRTRFGNPEAQEDIANLKGACELLQKYAAGAPEAGSFTPARELLDAEATSTCHRWHQQEAHAKSQAEHDRARAESERERAKHEAQRAQHEQAREAERDAQDRARLSAVADREKRTLETCDATESARLARKRHADILERAPGATVRKQCTPRMETHSVKAECKDANGFARPCVKTVSGNDVAGYTCPKTMDPEVVQLGLYQLDLLDGYPFSTRSS